MGERRDDPRSDIYAVGCVAYWLLTAQPVFDGESPLSVLMAHQQTTPEAPSTRVELPIPAELESTRTVLPREGSGAASGEHRGPGAGACGMSRA